MKRRIIITLSLAALLTSCVKEQDPEIQSGSLFLTAYPDEVAADMTKTHLENERYVLWDASDAITVLGSEGIYHSRAIAIKEGGRIATFTMPSGTNGSLALYPKDESASFSDGKVTTTLPTVQTAAEGSFAQGANLALAKVTDLSSPLYYCNAGAVLSLTVNMEGITKIVLEPLEDGKRLAGACTLAFDSKGLVSTAPVGTGTQGVTLQKSEGTFTKDQTYSLVVLPGTYNGLKVTMTNALGQGVTYKNSTAITLKSNDNYFIADLKNPEQAAGIDIDFSYAGYNHGESAPAEASTFGYTVYDVTQYGAIPNDGKSDREAFLACLKAALGVDYVVNANNIITFNSKDKANAIVYFPEGEFILHTSEDDVESATASDSQTIQIRSGNFVLRGAGRDKTTIVMQDPNQPASSALYSSPAMLELKHNSGLSEITKVSANAAKGSYSVQVESTTGLSEGQWVCLTVVNNDPAFVKAELAAGEPTETEIAGMTNITGTGVQVYDYHQIAKISGNTVTFVEPIMHEVDLQYTAFTGTKSYNWRIDKYPHYENVGVEDLTFKGNAKEGFVHHGSWQDDGAYKPVNMTRLTNSWMRRVGFTSVSEASSITNCSNISVYDVVIDGNRGHSAIRSQQSSRVFIGKVIDKSSGGLGQYHAVGVSKPAIGTVLWRNTWGSDSCFEAHATQPRATLIDCCTGGWDQMHQGGDKDQLPNHLADLVIWNFEATSVDNSTWDWWTLSGHSWKFLPVTVVGFHGASCTFTGGKCDISNGTAVFPESLYEQQLQARLGTIPSWLQALKAK